MKRIALVLVLVLTLLCNVNSASAQTPNLATAKWGRIGLQDGTVIKMTLTGVVGRQLTEDQVSVEEVELTIKDFDGSEIGKYGAIPVNNQGSITLEVIESGNDSLDYFPGGYSKDETNGGYIIDGQAYSMSLENVVGKTATYNYSLKIGSAIDLPLLDTIIVCVDPADYSISEESTESTQSTEKTNSENSAESAKPTETTGSQNSTESTKPIETTSTTTTAADSVSEANSQYYQYKINKGDTLATIALNYYGSYKYSNNIYKINKEYFKKHDMLYVGYTLNLDKSMMIQRPVTGENQTIYRVKAGDTLGIISKMVYGTYAKYNQLMLLNPQIKNVNLIYEGQEIIVPKK